MKRHERSFSFQLRGIIRDSELLSTSSVNGRRKGLIQIAFLNYFVFWIVLLGESKMGLADPRTRPGADVSFDGIFSDPGMTISPGEWLLSRPWACFQGS